jgi:hypothetical protein
MLVKEAQAFHHPRVEPAARMPRNFSNDVRSIFEPRQLGSGRRRKDRDFAILTLIAELGYDFAMPSETRFRVV